MPPMNVFADKTLRELGADIRRAREAREWTRPKVREETGLSESTIVRIERGEKVSLELLLAYAATMGVSVPQRLLVGAAQEAFHEMAAAGPAAGEGPEGLADLARRGAPAWAVSMMEQQSKAHAEVMKALDRIERRLPLK